MILALETSRLYLTVDEAGQYLRVSRRTLYTLMKRKQITFTRVREGMRFRLQWLFPLAVVERLQGKAHRESSLVPEVLKTLPNGRLVLLRRSFISG